MFPAQTSMMPATVALARFWESSFAQNGWLAIRSLGEGWYPDWYLGVPFKYLGGPIVPFLLAFLHRIFPQITLFEIYFFLTAFFWLFGGVTLYFLVRTLSQPGGARFWVVLIFLFGPFLPRLFPFSDGTRLISFSFLPLILLCYFEILKKWSKVKAVILVFLTTLSLLTDNLILPAILIGMLSLFLAVVPWKELEKQLKRTVFVLLASFFLATLWYSPAYWWHLWFIPSFAGKGLGSVMILMTRLLTVAIPVLLAIFSLRRFREKKNTLFNFAFLWTFIFGFLTLMRFISDPDFWQDWTSYALELQMGGAVILAIFIGRLLQSEKLSILPRSFFFASVAALLALPWILTPYKFLGLRGNIQNSVEYRVGKWLVENAKPDHGARVYLSGTTAFWLNSLFDVSQLRGGIDQGATHPFWAKASYEIREGQNPEFAEGWLRALGVSYLVVHDSTSEEYYHDFKYPDKFKMAANLRKAWQDKEDVIYKVEGANLARIVNLKTFKELRLPRDGVDQQVITSYVAQLVGPLAVKSKEANEIWLTGEVRDGEGVSLAVTWDKRWQCEVKIRSGTSESQRCRIQKDILGNILIDPQTRGDLEIRLEF